MIFTEKTFIKIFLLFALTAVFLMAAAGCRDDSLNIKTDDGTTKSPSCEITDETAENPSNNIEIETEDESHISLHEINKTVKFMYATDEVLSRYESFHEFILTEDAGWMVITTEETLKDFEYITVECEYEAEFAVWLKSVVYHIDELTPEKPFKIKSYTQIGVFPNYGISFTDKDNIKRYFYIAESGKDGSLWFVEF